MVTYGEKRDEYLQNNAIVDRLFWWYAEQNFPTGGSTTCRRLPNQIKVKAMSPLCHTSVSKWSLAAGVKDLHDAAKIERCAKVAGEVVYIVTTRAQRVLRRQVGRRRSGSPSKEIEHCIGCHGPDTPDKKPRRWNQQGHMECLMCHEDHTL